MVLLEIGCEGEEWTELSYSHVKWKALVLAVLNLKALLP